VKLATARRPRQDLRPINAIFFDRAHGTLWRSSDHGRITGSGGKGCRSSSQFAPGTAASPLEPVQDDVDVSRAGLGRVLPDHEEACPSGATS